MFYVLVKDFEATAIDEVPFQIPDSIDHVLGGPRKLAFRVSSPAGDGDLVGYVKADPRGEPVTANLSPELGGGKVSGPLIVLSSGGEDEADLRDLSPHEADMVTLIPGATPTQTPLLVLEP